MPEKICKECGSEEHYHAKELCKRCYGRQYNSGEARKAARRRYAASDAGKAARRRYAASDAGKAARRRYAASEGGKAAKQRYQAANPGKIEAHRVFHNALLAGKVVKQKLCSFCDNFAEEAHHSDYSKPLEVIWCCRDHHWFLHEQINPFNQENYSCQTFQSDSPEPGEA